MSPISKQELEAQIKDILDLLEKYRFCWDFHAVDFYHTNYFTKFPTEWQTCLETLTVQETIELASYYKVPDTWPDSIKEFVSAVRETQLSRIPEPDFQINLLNHRLIYGMTPQKRTEVTALASCIHHHASLASIKNICDLGAGQGYLDIALAFQYGYTVVGIDSDVVQTCGAKRLAKTVSRAMKWPEVNYIHVNKRVGPNDKFRDLVGPEYNGSPEYAFVGLHTCGNLTPFTINHFLQSSDAKLLVNVGCCYNKLTEPNIGQQCDETHGYPLSKYLKSRNFHLGYTARTLACQATCRWSTQPDCDVMLKNHHYRALIQYILKIQGHFPDDFEIVIGRLPLVTFTKGFVFYANVALEKLGKPGLISDAELNQFELEFQEREIQVAFVWTLRALLGSALESLILCDRALYLIEQGSTQVELFPLFDQVVSPRNMILIAKK